MPTAYEEDAHRVRFGETIAAVVRTVGDAWPALLIAWVAQGLIETALPLLISTKVSIPQAPYGPRNGAANLVLAAAGAAIAGLLIRRLLDGRRAALRPDGALAAYVGLMALAAATTLVVSFALLPNKAGKSAVELGALSAVIGVVSLALYLLYALLALWPIGVLTGDRVSLGAAVRLMRQAYFTYIGAMILLYVPAVAFIYGRILLGFRAYGAAGELLSGLVGGLFTTLATVLLAQIYARRVRGADLGTEPQLALVDVFE